VDGKVGELWRKGFVEKVSFEPEVEKNMKVVMQETTN